MSFCENCVCVQSNKYLCVKEGNKEILRTNEIGLKVRSGQNTVHMTISETRPPKRVIFVGTSPHTFIRRQHFHSEGFSPKKEHFRTNAQLSLEQYSKSIIIDEKWW